MMIAETTHAPVTTSHRLAPLGIGNSILRVICYEHRMMCKSYLKRLIAKLPGSTFCNASGSGIPSPYFEKR